VSGNECLIDFDPYPMVANPYYDEHWDDACDRIINWNEVYEIARSDRIARLRLIMRQRLLTEEETDLAMSLGYELARDCDGKDLADLWFNQHRLRMLAKGINIQ
jgi:hypothetical protein